MNSNKQPGINTVEILFSLLSFEMGAEYRRDPNELTDAKTLAKVCELADFHDLAHLIANALTRLSVIPTNERLAEAISKKQLHAILRAEHIDSELDDITKLFESEGIDYTPLKGAVIRELYPERWMRTSGDIDILVREEDAKRASELLIQKLSYSFEDNGSHDIQLKSPSGVPLELHFSLVDEDFAPEPLKHVWDFTYCHEATSKRKYLTDEMLVFYHVVHMAKHVKHGGCGIKPLLDMLVLEKSGKLDEGLSTELLKKSGLEIFFEVAKKLAKVWFAGEKHDELTKSLEDYILSAGVYGNLQNAVAAGQSERGGKFKYLMSRAFPSYGIMKYRYPILQKHKYLLPFCYIARWFNALFRGKTKSAVAELKLNTESPQKAQSISHLMNDLGLNKYSERKNDGNN